ncbi:MAG: hypothetical protein QOH62_3303 [Solirubrobacteraceae bacterium]|jgi:hypothetical protein|nr:hypothetical protein [Solirubrobacteraceae bacterium]
MQGRHGRVGALVATLACLTAPAIADAEDPVLAAAGDIACAPGVPATATTCQYGATASLIAAANPAVVAALGDTQYENATPADYAGAFDPTWGAFKGRIRPAVGNHEYQTPDAAGYFSYFGPIAGDPATGAYSYDVGAWHAIVLNSNCSIVSCADGSAQATWLAQDLAAHRSSPCTLAYWHHPRFSSQTVFLGDDPSTAPLFKALHDAGVDIVLSGHAHDYERFAQLTPEGVPSRDRAHGVREFVVGTGGDEHYSFAGPTRRIGSQASDDTTFGALFLTLHPSSYEWRFDHVLSGDASGSFTDASSAAVPCHNAPRKVRVRSSVLRVVGGRLPIKVASDPLAARRSTGTLVVTTSRPVRRGGHKRILRIAQGSFSVEPGATATARPLLTAAARSVLASLRGVRLKITAIVRHPFGHTAVSRRTLPLLVGRR